MTAQPPPQPQPDPVPVTVTTRNVCRWCRGVLEFLVDVGWIHAVDLGASAWGAGKALACERADPALWHCAVCHEPRPSRGQLPRIVDAHVAPVTPGSSGRSGLCEGSGRAGLPPPWV